MFIIHTKETHIEIFNFLKNLNSTTFEAKMPYYAECDIWIIGHFIAQPNVLY